MGPQTPFPLDKSAPKTCLVQSLNDAQSIWESQEEQQHSLDFFFSFFSLPAMESKVSSGRTRSSISVRTGDVAAGSALQEPGTETFWRPNGVQKKSTAWKSAITSHCCHVVMKGPELVFPTDSFPWLRTAFESFQI